MASKHADVDPWHSGSNDPWASFKSSSNRHHKSSCDRTQALLVIRGPYLIVHDADLAREFLAPLQAAHLSAICGSSLTVASPSGQGWRSKIVENKYLKKGAAVSADADLSKRVGETRPCAHRDVNMEVKKFEEQDIVNKQIGDQGAVEEELVEQAGKETHVNHEPDAENKFEV